MKSEDIYTKVYQIDKAHSNIGFKVKHMMFAHVNGHFDVYKAQMKLPNHNFERASLQFSAQTASINTHHSVRDEHLRSPDFFDIDLYKEIKYESTQIKHLEGENYEVMGLMTIKGIQHPVKLAVAFRGAVKDPWGVERIALEMRGKIDRYHWDMKWNKPLKSGGIFVSKEVKIIIESEFI